MSSHAHAGHCRRLFLLRRTSTSTKLLYLLVLLVAVVLIVDVCTASREFSTVAISHAPNATLVCALVTSSAADDAGSPGSKLHCTSHPDGQQFVQGRLYRFYGPWAIRKQGPFRLNFFPLL